MKNDYNANDAFWKCHAIAGTFHICAAFAIGLVGSADWPSHNRAVSGTLLDVTQWQYTCYNRTSEEYTTERNCDTEDRTFFPEAPSIFFGNVHVIALCILFSAWSGFVHIVRAIYIARWLDVPVEWNTETTVRFAVDYSVSASIMLMCMNALFGATNIFSIVAGPAWLACLLVASSILLNKVHQLNHEAKPVRTKAVLYTFVALCVIYLLIIVRSTGMAVHKITNVVDTERYGKAPTNILAAATSITVVFFSVFIFPYCAELFWFTDISSNLSQQLIFTSVYSAMSLGAKVLLHVVFVTTGQSQSKLLANDTDAPPPDADDQLKDLGISAGSVLSTSLFLFFIVHWCILKPARKRVEA